MKTRKYFIIIGVIAIISFVFAACKIDERRDYFGTWVFEGYGTKLIFSADKFVFLDERNELGLTVAQAIWTAVENLNEETKNDYPTGYRISGLITEHHGNVGWRTGDFIDHSWAYYLHKDKQRIIEQGTGRFDSFWFNELVRETN